MRENGKNSVIIIGACVSVLVVIPVFRSPVAVKKKPFVKNLIIIVQKTIMILYVFILRILRFDAYTDPVMSNKAPDNKY